MCAQGPPPTLAAMPTHPETTRPARRAGGPTPRRLNPFGPAHKALRHAQAALLQQLGTLDAHDAAEVQAALRALRALLEHQALLRRLAADHLYAALDEHQPGLSDCALRHAAQARQHAAALLALADVTAACTDPAPRERLLERLYQGFTALAAQQQRHMAHETQVLAPALQAWRDDAGLQALQRQALASLARWERQDLLQRLADGLSPGELAGLLLARRDDGAPEAWLAGAMAVQGRVGAARWAAIAARLQAAGARPPEG